MDYAAALALSVGFGLPLAAAFGALAQGKAAAAAAEGIARQPEAGDAVNQALILSLAMLESLAIYILAVMLILLFANPLKEIIVKVVE